MPTGAHRTTGMGATVFAEMSELSARHGAVNLGQGFPDFPGPDFALEAAIEAIRGHANQYAHPHGFLGLREAIADDWSATYGAPVEPATEITVTSGATEAITDAILAHLNPGDELVTFEPFYDSYPAAVAMAGGSMRVVRLEPPDWSFDPDRLRSAITPRTRIILLNTPHNPTGKVFQRNELELIADLAIEHDLLVITDEVYDQITFDGHRHVASATLPGMWDRTLTINSTGKRFSLTGWKIGYAIGPETLQRPLRAIHQFVTFATATPLQVGMAAAIRWAGEHGYDETLRREYTTRRDAMRAILESAGLPPLHVQGSYFTMASFEHLDFANDVAFSSWLIEERGVTPIPPSAFYQEPGTAPKLVRFCFAKDLATIAKAGERLGNHSHLPRASGKALCST